MTRVSLGTLAGVADTPPSEPPVRFNSRSAQKRGKIMTTQALALLAPEAGPAEQADEPTASRSGVYRTGRRTRVLLGAPDVVPATTYLQIFTWFTAGRDWARIEIRHQTDSGVVIQTAIDDTEMDPKDALTLATRLAGRHRIRLVYFQDALPERRGPHRDTAATDSWQVCIR